MACNLITNRARSLRSLLDQGIIDKQQTILKDAEFNYANVETTKQMEEVIGSKIPYNVFAYGLNANSVSTNDELFYRADAAEDIIYAENEKFKNNYQYPIDSIEDPDDFEVDPNTALEEKLEKVLEGIGVSVNSLANGRFKSVSGVADAFHKVASASINKDGVSNLSEEASHMFVEFIEQHEPSLFNKLMADIPKYGIYSEVKNEYMPIYNDINQVKKEAIGKAISAYIVGDRVDKNTNQLISWFDKVLNSIKKVLADFGILTQEDYNNYFEITANKILAGDFVGSFEGKGIYYNIDNTSGNASLDLLDRRNGLLELKDTGDGKQAYFFNGKQVKHRVTEKIKGNKITKNSNAGDIAQAVGRAGHEDLMNLWKIKTGELAADKVVIKTSNTIFGKLANFVDLVSAQFPDSEFRTEVKVYDENSDTAGTIDLLIIEPNGRVNIFDYKFREGTGTTTIISDYNKQLAEYKRILKRVYKFTDFGQTRVLPFQTRYVGKLEKKVLTDINFGTNTFDNSEDRLHLNPQPATFETTENTTINSMLQYLNEELMKNKNIAANTDIEQENKKLRSHAIRQTIARLQITRDITSLETIAQVDKERMQYILRKQNPTPNELVDLSRLRDHYEKFIKKEYNIDKEGNTNIALTEIAAFAQTESAKIDKKLEAFLNNEDINTSVVNKPMGWAARLTQLSDHDNPAFKALYRLLNKGFALNEIKIRKTDAEIKDIVDQIKREEGKSGVDMYEKIIQKDANGKLTNKLIAKTKKEWYELHNKTLADPSLKSTISPYFDTKAWKEYYDPLEKDFVSRNRGMEESALNSALYKFRSSMERNRGIGNANSKFFTIPDKYLNDDYLKFIKNAPESGLAKLYNKYMEINKFARENSETDIPLTLLPYIKKSTVEMVVNDGFNIKNLTTNALDKMKSYEWETYGFDSTGERIYQIPLKFKGDKFNVKDDQSHDLGIMLSMWTESVYSNAYLQDTHSTALLYQLALKKSKEVSMKNGKPVFENGELRTGETSKQTLEQFQEYLNMYYYGVNNETSDREILGFSGHKIVRAGMSLLSGKAIGLNVFSGLANITGGFAQAYSIGAKNNLFTKQQFTTALTSLHDPKNRALFSLLDVTNTEYKQAKIANLSASKAEALVSWDNLFVLQRGGDWLLQNGTLSAMAQNFTVKQGKIVKKSEGETSLLESINFDKDKKVVIEGLDLNKEEDYLELLKFREKVRRVGAEITGNTSEHDKYLIKNTLTGQLLMQFRGWIPALANSRFGKLKHSAILEQHQIGKYRSTWQLAVAKAKSLYDQQLAGDLESILQKEYEAASILNPNLEYEEFKKMYIGNMHSTFMELAIYAGITALLYAMDDDDNSDDSMIWRFLSRGLARTGSELSFWYSTDSAMSIVRAPIPLLGLVGDILDLFKVLPETTVDLLFAGETDTKAGDKLAKLTPAVASYYKLLKDLED